MKRALKIALDGSLLVLALLVLALSVTDRVARAATADGGVNAQGEAGAPGEPVADAGASGVPDAGLPPEYAPLKCDGSLCDTTTGETTCSVSEGRSAKHRAWPFVMLLALAAAGIRRREQSALRRLS
jgi:MYXO-CTERM domain-containing protein